MSESGLKSGDETVLEVSNVWKIFGNKADQALSAIQQDGLR